MRPDQARRKAWALLPVKNPKAAKMRLSSRFTSSEREALQHAMLTDVLTSLSRARSLEGIAVISSDPGIGLVARTHGSRFIAECPAAGNLNGALAMGARCLKGAGAEIIAVIPADLPLIDAADVDRAVRAADSNDTVVVVPDRHREGTNALVFLAGRPPEFRFGPGSFRRHLSSSGGQSVAAMELPSMALDIDLPDDISTFCASRGDSAPATRAMMISAEAHRTNRGMCGCLK